MEPLNYTSLYLFGGVCLALMFGYPVAYTLAGTALPPAAYSSAASTPPSSARCPDACSAP